MTKRAYDWDLYGTIPFEPYKSQFMCKVRAYACINLYIYVLEIYQFKFL